MTMTNSSLSLFHPILVQWFRDRVGMPTDIQERSWPLIAEGRHVLITAPTGSGKTLAAFLWAIHQLIAQPMKLGKTRVLYVSPLKALNNDIQRNLLSPLAELQAAAQRKGDSIPGISVLTRSGDTDPSERSQMLRRPPEILITTPESLNILLTSQRGRTMLSDVECVILDEIHSVVGGKRGTHLITAVERLALWAGEFQRIALSATVKPIDTIAEWVAGYRLDRHETPAKYHKRSIQTIESTMTKQYQIQVQFPEEIDPERENPSFWPVLIQEIKPIVSKNRSTLIFTNNRMHCERISLLLNQDQSKPVAYSHHGSLSRETRLVVEHRLKQGELAAIVATSSLELGIDIGSLDEVVMVQTPPAISSALQRLGRAGHRVGEPSVGSIFPIHGRDLAHAAVACRCVTRRDIEPIHPIEGPLDVLAQIVISMTGVEAWDIDDLYDAIRCAVPYQSLRRDDFDRVLMMLCGQYTDIRLRQVQPMLSIDRAGNTVKAKDHAVRRLYSSGGTIPDRGYYTLRHQNSGVKIGELDEEFVWERRLGDTFILGTQIWRIRQITHNDVLVVPSEDRVRAMPFWKAENQGRDFYFSTRINEFLEYADQRLEHPSFTEELQTLYCMSESAARSLIHYLRRQKKATGCSLPHRRHVVIETTELPGFRFDRKQVLIHTNWGGKVNQPLALILGLLWTDRTGNRADCHVNNDGIAFMVSQDGSFVDLIHAIQPDRIEQYLRETLETSGFFGARFRENSARALLLPRDSFGRRTPLWLNRLRSQTLLETVSKLQDFPILVETWRTCLRDEFDLPSLIEMLKEIQSGEIEITETVTSRPSPFAEGMLWQQTNQYMYRNDGGLPGRSNLRDDLVREVIQQPGARSAVSSSVIFDFVKKAQRVETDYSPHAPSDLFDWVKERLFIPYAEWQSLRSAIERDHSVNPDDWREELNRRVVAVLLPRSEESAIVAVEIIPRMLSALALEYSDPRFLDAFTQEPLIDSTLREMVHRLDMKTDSSLEDWLAQWLQFYGPVPVDWIQRIFGIPQQRIATGIQMLVDEEKLIQGLLTEGGTEVECCDLENYEILLRMARKAAMPAIQPLSVEQLPLFLAYIQRIAKPDSDETTLEQAIETLFGFAAPPDRFEAEFIPARLPDYQTGWMDRLMQDNDLVWMGHDAETVLLVLRDQLGMFRRNDPAEGDGQDEEIQLNRLFPDKRAKYDFSRMAEHSGYSTSELTELLWKWVWKGTIANDSFVALRKGIDSGFQAWTVSPDTQRRSSSFGQWKSSRPFAGNWYRLPDIEPPVDAIDELEQQKEIVRLLLGRYGILFRDLLQKEIEPLRWKSIFRALRIMEFSGEVVSGYFFEGINGIQFMSPSALRRLPHWLPEDAIYWMNATDPASLCGIPLTGLPYSLPDRRPSNHVVYHGTSPVLISKRSGKELEILVSEECESLPRYCCVLRHLLTRSYAPVKAIVIETINGYPAVDSPYAAVLRNLFDARSDLKKITIRKRYY